MTDSIYVKQFIFESSKGVSINIRHERLIFRTLDESGLEHGDISI